MNLDKRLEQEIERLMGGLTSKQCHADEMRQAMLAALHVAANICAQCADDWTGPLGDGSGVIAANGCADSIRALAMDVRR